jgi:hypothetical protein
LSHIERARAGVEQVVAGIELLVVDPHRVVHLERHLGEALAIARRVVQPPGDVRRQLVEGGGRSVLGRVESGDPADVHRRGAAFDGEERRVEG